MYEKAISAFSLRLSNIAWVPHLVPWSVLDNPAYTKTNLQASTSPCPTCHQLQVTSNVSIQPDKLLPFPRSIP